MDLAIPIIRNDNIYTSVELRKLYSQEIAKIQEIAERGFVFRAMLELISKGIESISTASGDQEIDKKKIERICNMMSFVTAETLSYQIFMKQRKIDDYIEGVYPCPRCGTEIITGNDGIIDNRDRISELNINYMNEESIHNICVTLEKPVKIINEKTTEVLEEINSFEIRYPTLGDYIKAANGQNNNSIIQLKAYCNAIQKINDQNIEQTWISMYGMLLMNRLYSGDLESIKRQTEKYGVQKTIKRICNRCGKEWDSILPTSNFFVLGLRPT
jgi:hypothetical protein